MKSLVILEPVRVSTGDPVLARLLSEDPREGVIATQHNPTTAGVALLMSSKVRIKTAFFGYISGLPSDALFYLDAIPSGSSQIVSLVGTVAPIKGRREAASHFYGQFQELETSQVYLRIYRSGGGNIDAASITIGVAALFGDEFRPQWGHEWGAGRPLDDTSAVERLPSGSFAIDPGIVTSGYQWTFGDLSDDERERLYDIHKAVGRHRSVLVIEDDDRTPGLYERMHWGLLQKLDTYARVDPTATTWNMQVADWL